MKNPKLQIVTDPVIRQCLKDLPGVTKKDKIKWALCVYTELQRTHRTSEDTYQKLMNLASARYQGRI